MSDPTCETLLARAAESRENAYAPFSKYRVGAALLAADGQTYSGCNIENASFGASMCAERVAVFKMVSEGGVEIKAMAVMTADGGMPCGMCLQVIREFTKSAEDLPIWCASTAGVVRRFTLKDLLPFEFDFAGEPK
jgi:cytidine deaminase